MTLQERLLKYSSDTFDADYEADDDKRELARINATQAIEKDILELIGEDEKYDDYGGVAINRDAYEPIIRNELRGELRLKLKDYCSGIDTPN